MEQYLDYIDAKRAEAGVADGKGRVEVIYETCDVLLTHRTLNIEKHRGFYYPRYFENKHCIRTIHEVWQDGEQTHMEIWILDPISYRNTLVKFNSYDFENGRITIAQGSIPFEKKGDSQSIVTLYTSSGEWHAHPETIIINEHTRQARGSIGPYDWRYSFAEGVRPLQLCEYTSQIIFMPTNYEITIMNGAISLSKVQFDTCIDLPVLCSFYYNRKGNTLSGRFVNSLRRYMRKWLIRARRKKVQAVLMKPLAAVVCSYL